MEVKTKDISKICRVAERDIKVLDKVNISVSSGAFVIILGPSGAGKTTLLSILSGIEPATSGRVFFNGLDFMTMNEKEHSDFRLRQIGFMFQNFNLIPSLTVRENVSLPLVNLKRKDEISAKTGSLMERVGIANRSDNLPDTLSCGERQRVAIARAIANNPRLILADDPTANLDDESSAKVMQILHKLNQEDKSTVILCTNRSEIANQKCDKLYKIEGGRVEAGKGRLQ